MHAEANFGGPPQARLITWDANPGALLDIYFNTGEEDLALAPAGGTQFSLETQLNPLTGQWRARLTLAGGLGGVYLYSQTNQSREAHLYLAGGAFRPGSVSYSHLVSQPGTAAHAITVGSYDWNDLFHADGKEQTLLDPCRKKELIVGDLSCYSSPGPRRDGSAKPEIAAPGEWFAAAYAKDLRGRGVAGWGAIDTTGNYVAMNGTSAATPYTAGLIALLFQHNPRLTLGQVRELLQKHATRDPFTNDLPNGQWGYGKLDLRAVQRIFASVPKTAHGAQ
jgi:subtilisin family serine protease